MFKTLAVFVFALGIGAISSVSARKQGATPTAAAQPKIMAPKAVLAGLVGEWKGKCRTWFEPNKLEDESIVTGKFEKVMGGRFIRHTYTGSMKGKPRTGEELIAYNSVDKVYEISWIDDFHMSYAILFSTGKGTETGFSVLGHYDSGPGTKPWGWRTEFVIKDSDHMTITAYNSPPGEAEAKAVELVYERVK